MRAAGFTWAAGAVDFVLRIGSTAVLARLILPEHFGLVMMVMAVTAIADQFRDLGLSSATIQRQEISHEEVTNLFWINTALGLTITLGIWCASPLIAAYYKEPRLIAIACILATNFLWGGMMVQHQALLTRQLRLGTTSTVRLTSSVLSTALAIVLAWFGFGYWALVWREVSRTLIVALGMFFCLPWIPGLPSRKTSVRGLVSFGTDMTVAYTLSSISSSFDRLLLGRFCGAAPVAMYRQAFQLIVTPMEQMFSPINQVASPGLSHLQNEDLRFRRFYLKILSVICLTTMPLSLFVAVYSQEISRVVLGRKWLDAGPILCLLAIGSFIKWAGMPSPLVLITRGLSRRFLVFSVATNVLVVIAMAIGVRWGVLGLAVGDVAATYLLLVPKLQFCFWKSPVSVLSFFGAIARPAFASLAMAAVLVLIRSRLPGLSPFLSLCLGGLLAAVLFCGAYLVTPGGKQQLLSLVDDLRSALGKKLASKRAAQPTAVAN